MMSLPRALALSLGQMGDPAILRVLAKTVAITVVIFVALWLALLWFFDFLAIGYEAYLFDGLVGLAAAMVSVVAFWFLFRMVALFVLQFFADEVVAAVERRHYPQASEKLCSISIREELNHSLGAALRALLANLLALPFAIALLVTGIGTVILFWAVNAWLLGRELRDMVWLRHRSDEREQAPLGFATRFALGGVVAAMLLVPFVNLLAPIIGAATATHLVHRARTIHA